MNRFILICILISNFTLFATAQNGGNSHFFKLVIQNEDDQILLIKFDDEWEVPGSRYKTNVTIPQYLDKMAADHGVTVRDPQLEALVTFHHDVRDIPTMMFYYSVSYDAGELITPSWGNDVQWFSLEEAYKIIPYAEMNYILKSITASEQVLSGAFRITYDKETEERIGFEIMDDLKR